MFVRVTGSGPALLLLHGGGVAGWMWRPTLAALDAAGAARLAVVPDLPGHGESWQQEYRSHDATCAALAGVLEAEAPRGAVVVGFSLGAQLAILLAARHPDLVRGVVVVSAETVPAPMPGTTLAVLGASAPLARRAWFARLQGGQLSVPPDLLDDYVRDSARLGRGTLLNSVGENMRFTLPEGWSSFQGQARVLVGARESALMRRSARLTSDALPGSTLQVVPRTGHDIPFLAPDVAAEAVRSLP